MKKFAFLFAVALGLCVGCEAEKAKPAPKTDAPKVEKKADAPVTPPAAPEKKDDKK